MDGKSFLDLNEEIEINIIEYYSNIRSKINKDIIQIINDPQSNLENDELNALRELGDLLIMKTNSILESSIDKIEKYFSNLKQLNQLFSSIDDLNDFFDQENMDIDKNHKSNIKINDESIKTCALVNHVMYISKLNINPKSVAAQKKTGVYIVFDYYPNINQRNYINSIFEGNNYNYEFDENVLNLKYQLDKQITVVKDIRETPILQLAYIHVNIAPIIYIKKQDISNLKSLKLLIKSPIEASSMLKIDPNTFSNFKNLEDLNFTGFIETSSNFQTYTSVNTFNLNSSINIFKPIQSLISLTNLSIKKCPFESLEDGIFKCLINLKHLDLSSNKLKTLKKENFEGLDNLVYLNLSDNYIKEITGFPFQHLKSLKILDLHYNYIDDLKLDSFGYSLVNLKVLDLKNNDFKEIRKNVLKHLTNLKEIHLPGYFVNYPSRNLFKEIGVQQQTVIKIENPDITFNIEYL